MPLPFFLSFLLVFMRKRLPGLSSFKTQDSCWLLSLDIVPVISITPLWTFETVILDEHVAWGCPLAEGHQASRRRNECKRIENILQSKACVALFRQRPILLAVLRANKRPVFLRLYDSQHDTLERQKPSYNRWWIAISFEIISLMKNSGSSYSNFLLRLNPSKVRQILFGLGGSQK